MNRKAILTAIAVTVIGAGTVTASSAFAQTETPVQDPMNSLIQKISDKFGLNKEEVQAVFDESHKERHAAMQADFEAQLSQYVENGEITEAQKQLILKKRQEMDADRQSNKDSFKNLSKDERKVKMDDKKAELDAWATENKIDLKYLMPHGGKGHGMGGRGSFDRQDHMGKTPIRPTTIQ
ncbi:MAG: hypothetical protein H0W89_01785 [Candidatus Levybacteria bacterium]|nr:hypothetical protein [Candidatus Levybacteria bacterium]